jgi:hypothetical protein
MTPQKGKKPNLNPSQPRRLKVPGVGTMVVDYNLQMNPADANVITLWASEQRQAGLLDRLRDVKTKLKESQIRKQINHRLTDKVFNDMTKTLKKWDQQGENPLKSGRFELDTAMDKLYVLERNTKTRIDPFQPDKISNAHKRFLKEMGVWKYVEDAIGRAKKFMMERDMAVREARELVKLAREVLARDMSWHWQQDETSWSLTWKPGANYVEYDYHYHPDVPPERTKRLNFEQASKVWNSSKHDYMWTDENESPPWLEPEKPKAPEPEKVQQKMRTVDDDMSKSLFFLTKRGGEYRSDKQREFFLKVMKRGERPYGKEKMYLLPTDYGIMIGPPFQKGALSGVPIFYLDAQGVRLYVLRWQAGKRSGLKKKWER